MPTTRRSGRSAKVKKEDHFTEAGQKRDVDKVEESQDTDTKPPAKKKKTTGHATKETAVEEPSSKSYARQIGTIERGHIYFFYRPKVELEEAHSIDDVKNLHMVLVPGLPQFSSYNESSKKDREPIDSGSEMNLLSTGADAVPEDESDNQSIKRFRLITIGRKQLPEPEGSRQSRVFWASVNTVGEDLHALEQGLGEKTYETKTRGTRHNESARLVGRGAYAIVNNEPRISSESKTHIGYYLSHPKKLGDVQASLGIHRASSFVLQVKNPLAPNTGNQRVGLPASRRADYPEEIMHETFGQGTKGREQYGLRFVGCERTELLDCEGAELLLIASKQGNEGVEESLGDGRGEALEENEEREGRDISVEQVFKQLALDHDKFPSDALEGHWI